MPLAPLHPDRRCPCEEFRQWCEAQPRGRCKRVDGRIVAMSPECGAHLRVNGAVYKVLDRAIIAAGAQCQALPYGATVETGDSDYGPDALLNCGEPMAMGDDALAAPNPVIIAEVLSPGAAAIDTGGKLADYFKVTSVAHYLIVHPTRRAVTHHRWADDAIDTRLMVNGPIMMDLPGIVITVEELYENRQRLPLQLQERHDRPPAHPLGSVTELCDAEVDDGSGEMGEAHPALTCLVTPERDTAPAFQLGEQVFDVAAPGVELFVPERGIDHAELGRGVDGAAVHSERGAQPG